MSIPNVCPRCQGLGRYMNKFKLGVFHCEDCNGSGWGRSQQILMEPVKEPEKPVEKPSGNEWELSE